jgi:hypothetical protein
MIEKLKIVEEITESGSIINKIIVPESVRFISDWGEYNLNDFNFQHILDKKVPGCGYTEYCLRNDMDIILCSPRKVLLQNKKDQHEKDVFYFKNDIEPSAEYDKDLDPINKDQGEDNDGEGGSRIAGGFLFVTDKELKQKQKREEKIRKSIEDIKIKLNEYINKCLTDQKPLKILVTYDSFRILKEALEELKMFDRFYTVVDEFQSILVDSRFKAGVELEFAEILKGVNKVCYVSATPMIEKYLKQIELFKDTPYYELDWEKENPIRILKPDLKIRAAEDGSIFKTAKKIIDSYLNGKFESASVKDENGNVKVIESKEAVFFVNSVNNICDIIKKNKLSPSQVSIFCADTQENRKKVKKKKLGAGFEKLIGEPIPLKGQPRKMFTFCTRTVYLGADFYSDNARTFILSDANIDSLAVDISLDLPQILGRQRLNENPWRNRGEFYYKINGKEIPREEFDDKVRKKDETTAKKLENFQQVPHKDVQISDFEKVIKLENYKDDYVGVNYHGGSVPIAVPNYLVRLAEERAFDIQQLDYKDRFSVFNSLLNNNLTGYSVTKKIYDTLTKFESFTNFKDKFCYILDPSLNLNKEEFNFILDQIPLGFRDKINVLGIERCRELCSKRSAFNVTRLKEEYEDCLKQKSTNNLKSSILEEFKVGEKYSKNFIKEKLSEIYKNHSLTKKTAKATDINEYFETKNSTRIVDDKRENVLEIVKLKD